MLQNSPRGDDVKGWLCIPSTVPRRLGYCQYESLTFLLPYIHQGCQVVYFHTKNPNLGKFWRVLQWKMLEYFMAVWNILRPFGIFGCYLVDLVAIW
jgi:hypothetical protein